MLVIKILQESFIQAIQQLVSNKLRSFLTLLGITIGIFCVIAVLSSVDSLEDNILESFDKLGNDVIYVDKMPWTEDPGPNWAKYMARPSPSMEDLKAIQNRSQLAEVASLMVFIPGRLIRFRSNYVEGAYMCGVTEDYDKIVKFDIAEGNYFSPLDFHVGSNVAIIGSTLSESLFPNTSAIGKEIKLYGQYFKIVGLLKKEGKSIIDVMPNDEAVFIPFNTARKLVSVKSNSDVGLLLAVKNKKNADINELKLELTSILRSERNLRPVEKDNFAVNVLSLLTQALSAVFGSLNIAGFAIGGFAMLVGAFSVANIMFVSVKERTPFIGIKMAIGAKRYHILLEYLIEAIVLCIIGGIIGLAMVYVVLTLVSKAVDFPIFLSLFNVSLGILLSIIIGIIAGLIPALLASRMDPVEAIRK